MLDEDGVSLELSSLPLGGCKGPALLLLFRWMRNVEAEAEAERGSATQYSYSSGKVVLNRMLKDAPCPH